MRSIIITPCPCCGEPLEGEPLIRNMGHDDEYADPHKTEFACCCGFREVVDDRDGTED